MNHRRSLRIGAGIVAAIAVVALVATAIGSGSDDPQHAERVATSISTSPQSSSTAASPTTEPAPLPGVPVVAEPSGGVEGELLAVSITGLSDFAGQDATFGLYATPLGEPGGGGTGVVDGAGRLEADLYVRNVFGHDTFPVPETYLLQGSAGPPGSGLTFHAKFTIRRADVGVTYRHLPGYGCSAVIWFDSWLWFATDEASERAQMATGEGTIQLLDQERAVFRSPEAGEVALRAASPDERAAFPIERDHCHGARVEQTSPKLR